MKRTFTPERITSLEDDEIFVFGSNLAGMHGGGAALMAYRRFGAVWGQGVGLQGHSYAIPTMQGGIETIKPYTEQFTQFAAENREMKFLVTRIGCGIAGFSDEEIAPLFDRAYELENVVLPESFCRAIEEKRGKKAVCRAHTMGLAAINRMLRGEDPFPEKTVTATADSFRTMPMPEKNVLVGMSLKVNPEDFSTIEMGHIADCMEDKWNMYCDGGCIRWYRSWTSFCIFEAYYSKTADCVTITGVRINQDPDQFSGTPESAVSLFLCLTAGEMGYDDKEYFDDYYNSLRKG